MITRINLAWYRCKMMKNAALGALVAAILLGSLVSVSLGGDYKSTLEEHWLRILSPEENLDFGHMHPTLDAARAR